MNYKWRPQEEHLLKLLLPTNTYKEISIELNKRFAKRIPGFPCERSPDAVRLKCEREGIAAGQVHIPHEVEHFETIKKIQDQYRAQSVKRYKGVMAKENIERKILSLSDIHFPLAREDLLWQAIEDHEDADIVVLNGDIMEGYIFSTFAKSRTIAALDEYNCAFAFIKELSERFPQVVLVEGNHDVRAANALKHRDLPVEASQVLRPNLLARIANGEQLDSSGLLVAKHDFSNVYFEPRESWYVKIGKTIFMHPSAWAGGTPGGTVISMGEKLLNRYSKDEVDSFVCGHTHRIYKGVINSILYVEQGCLCDVMQYLHSAKNISKQHFMNGYAVIYQDKNGNTCFNESGPIFLGEALPPKKEIAL